MTICKVDSAPFTDNRTIPHKAVVLNPKFTVSSNDKSTSTVDSTLQSNKRRRYARRGSKAPTMFFSTMSNAVDLTKTSQSEALPPTEAPPKRRRYARRGSRAPSMFGSLWSPENLDGVVEASKSRQSSEEWNGSLRGDDSCSSLENSCFSITSCGTSEHTSGDSSKQDVVTQNDPPSLVRLLPTVFDESLILESNMD
eukprot:CAMPEP_0116863878 /NCGR_PEP_ID=MMETSP0418-20121206/24491_1 /TAXON_ID=1158023 /ORGANISM="Astrosyne radiata, Strain 13vi08-1A" /LENGTH=196 /DNA_ID=CAMNT_0004498997 /DNA_START=90 /DNA_END=680 /DNA_ORIENTATION=-